MTYLNKIYAASIVAILAFSMLACGDAGANHNHGHDHNADGAPSHDGHSVHQVEYDRLYTQLMGAHDEVMPMTGKVGSMRRELTKKVEGIKEMKGEMMGNVKSTVDQMQKAEDAMYEWMAGMGDLKETMKSGNHDAIMEKFAIEQKKIEEIKAQTSSSFEAGQLLLTQIDNQKY